MSHVLNTLGQSVSPKIFESLTSVGLVDTMNITVANETQGADGGMVHGARSNAYTNIPVKYKPKKQSGSRLTVGDQITTIQEYELTFPTRYPVTGGSAITIDPAKHRLEVIARGDQPVLVFKIERPGRTRGFLYEMVCTLENE